MKYFTKEWYELCQKIGEHVLLEEDEQAEFFSEEYFQQLYNEKLEEHLDTWERLPKLKKEKEKNDSYEPFNKEKSSQQFHEWFMNWLERIKKILPENILNKIVDIRVFVLNRASRKVINAVKEFSENNNKSVHRTIEKYEEYYKKSLHTFDREMVKNFHFHDCKIIDMKQIENSLSISFDNSGGFTDIDEVIFDNYKIIKQDAPLLDSWWLYEEVYKTNGKYELHVLLDSEELIDFVITAQHISYKRNKRK